MARAVRLDLDNVPLADLRRRISNFRTLDLRNTDQASVDARVKIIIDQFMVFQEQLYFNRALRARANRPGEIFERKDQIWYPPAGVSKVNRLSDAGEVLFYCADSASTALNEIGVGPGTVATLVHLVTRSEVATLHHAFIGMSQARSGTLDTATYLAKRSRFEAALGPSRWRKYEMIDGWLADLVTREVPEGSEHLYRPTIGWAHAFFTGPIKALHYPSVKTGYEGLNLAILPDVADATLEPYQAWMVAFGPWTDVQGKRLMPATPIRRSNTIGSDGVISWRPDGEGLEDFEKVISPPPQMFRK